MTLLFGVHGRGAIAVKETRGRQIAVPDPAGCTLHVSHTGTPMVKRGSPLGGHHVGQGGLARFIMGMGIMGLPVGISSGDQLAHGARLRKDLISVMLWAGRTAQDAGVYGWVQDETLKARSSQRCHASFVSRRSWAH